MKQPVLIALALVLTDLSAWADSAVHFTSQYTEFTVCRPALDSADAAAVAATGGDVPRRCQGIDGYYVYESYGAVATYRYIRLEDSEFSAALLPETDECAYPVYGDKIEWRLANHKPFAVISRVRCYGDQPDRDGNPETSRNFKGEFLLIRGLQDYPIMADLDLGKVTDGNQKARDLADRMYTGR